MSHPNRNKLIRRAESVCSAGQACKASGRKKGTLPSQSSAEFRPEFLLPSHSYPKRRILKVFDTTESMLCFTHILSNLTKERRRRKKKANRETKPHVGETTDGCAYQLDCPLGTTTSTTLELRNVNKSQTSYVRYNYEHNPKVT